MKTKANLFARRLALTLLAMLTTNVWAQISLTQDGNNNYLINTVNDWNILAEYVAAGNDCAGMTFLMTDDIATVTRPLGQQIGPNKDTDRMRFAGTFDGNNNKLTIALDSDDSAGWFTYEKGYCSPFAYLKGATIKNLHVDGTVTTTGPWASGLAGSTGSNSNNGTCTIENCQVSVEITTNYVSHNGKYGNHGGFIGIAEGNATITDSWFDGKFLGLDYKYSAGFIGINKGAAIISNCLFNPEEINIENNNIEGSCEFSHDMHDGSHTLTNAYWVKHFGEPENAQGQKVIPQSALPQELDASQTDFDYYVTTLVAADDSTYYIVKHNPTWMDVQANMWDGIDMELHASIEAGTEDSAIVIPNGVAVTLTLDGTLDRGLMLGTAQADGYVIIVEEGGSLTINGGTITGGHNTGNGGGIYNAGMLNIVDTTITGNFTEGNGGGIYNAGVLTLNGATITGNLGKNSANRGLGVYVAEGSTFNVQGNVQITGNYYKYQNPTVVKVPHNVYLDGSMITVVDALVSGTSIKVEGANGVFTSGLSGNGNVSYFSSDDENYGVVASEGEAYMAAYLKVNVEGYGTGTGKWMLIASPIAGNVSPSKVKNMVSSYNNYDLYCFNQSVDDEWENYKVHHFVLENGRGYLYANKNNVTLRFLGIYNQGPSQDVELTYDNGKEFAGWNLVGNPFNEIAYIADGRDFYTMKAGGSEIMVSTSDSIQPMEGIFVIATEDKETITFTTTEPAKEGKSMFALNLSQGHGIIDRAIVRFGEGHQLPKFQINKNSTKVYIPQEGMDYAVVSASNMDEMPVSFKAEENGTYTLSLGSEEVEFDYLHLIDNMTGADIDLLQTPSYSFEARTTDYENRFRLVFASNNNGTVDNGFAYISNGDIIVNGEGMLQIVDMTGRVVLGSSNERIISTSAMSSGLYILQLTNGTEVKTQKILVK